MNQNKFTTWPVYAEEEVEAVARVLQSGKVNYWTGDECRNFESEFSAYCGVSYGVALANGTVALELALRALGVGLGDEVIVTSRTFFASVSAIVMIGAIPVFADIDRDSQNITVETIGRVITPKSRAIIAVHLAGWPCDMEPIMALAQQYNLKVIEDCAQAHGAIYNGQKIGSLGHAAAFSFCQDKIISTGGEGGMLLTNDKAVWRSAWEFKDHGKSWDAVYSYEHPPGFRWQIESFGTNWRMTEMQAAIGRIQLKKLDSWIEGRQQKSKRFDDALSKLSLFRVVNTPSSISHARYKYYTFVNEGALKHGWNRNRIVEGLRSQEIPAMAGSCSEVYREKAFEGSESAPRQRLSVAEELGRTALMLPVDPTVSMESVTRAIEVLEGIAEEVAL